jgi:hypothetical protein
VKKDGRREPFDRNKLLRGLMKACEKRPVETKTLEDICDAVESELSAREPREMTTLELGASIMEKLKDLDQVAYLPLRGASRLPEKLRTHRAAAYLARSLTRIHCDAPLAADREALLRRSPQLPELAGFCSRHGFGAMLPRQAERIARLAA